MSETVDRTESEFKKIQQRLLSSRIERLQHLLQLNAPRSILEKEGELVIRGMIGVVGPGVLAALGKHLLDEERVRLLICPFHDDDVHQINNDNRAPSGDNWGMCDECLQSAREDDEAIDKLEEDEEE